MEGADWLERALAKGGAVSPESLEAHIGLGFLLPKSGRGSAEQGEQLVDGSLRHSVPLQDAGDAEVVPLPLGSVGERLRLRDGRLP